MGLGGLGGGAVEESEIAREVAMSTSNDWIVRR